MSHAKRSLDVLTVRSPCTEDWDLMTGTDEVRHCDVCDRSVYDLSGLSRDDAEALVTRTEGAPCIRFYRRADGTVITKDCAPERFAAQRKVARKALRFGAVMVGGLLSLTAGLGWAALFGYHELFETHDGLGDPCETPMMGDVEYDPGDETPDEPTDAVQDGPEEWETVRPG